MLGQIGVVGYNECSQLYISCGASSSSLSSPLHHPLLHRRIALISANAMYATTSIPPPCGSSHIACIPVSPHTHVRPGAISLVLLAAQCQYSGLASIQTQQPLQGSPQSFNSDCVVSFTVHVRIIQHELSICTDFLNAHVALLLETYLAM